MAVDFVRTVARAKALQEQAKANLAEAKDLLDSLGPLEVRQYVAGDYILKVEPNRRFDPATAKKNLTDKQYKSILKATPDSALAKALLDDAYSLCQKDYEPKRTIVRVEDEE